MVRGVLSEAPATGSPQCFDGRLKVEGNLVWEVSVSIWSRYKTGKPSSCAKKFMFWSHYIRWFWHIRSQGWKKFQKNRNYPPVLLGSYPIPQNKKPRSPDAGKRGFVCPWNICHPHFVDKKGFALSRIQVFVLLYRRRRNKSTSLLNKYYQCKTDIVFKDHRSAEKNVAFKKSFSLLQCWTSAGQAESAASGPEERAYWGESQRKLFIVKKNSASLWSLPVPPVKDTAMRRPVEYLPCEMRSLFLRSEIHSSGVARKMVLAAHVAAHGDALNLLTLNVKL